MPSFGVIAKRLGEFATGMDVGRRQQEQLYRQENRQALDFSLRAGAAGLDPAQFSDAMYTPGNPFAGTLRDKSSVFLSPYEASLATTARNEALANRKISIDEEANRIRENQGLLDTQARLAIADATNKTRLQAAGIAAAASQRAAGVLAKGAATWGDMNERDAVVRNSVMRQMMARGLLTNDDIEKDDNGNWLGVSNSDKVDAYNDVTNKIYRQLDQDPNALAVDVSPMIGAYLDAHKSEFNLTDSGDNLSLTGELGMNEFDANQVDQEAASKYIISHLDATRAANLKIDDPERRRQLAMGLIDALKATYPDVQDVDWQEAYDYAMGD